MATAIEKQLLLSEAERLLIVELLDRERSDLRVEIHHTRTATFRDELKRRLEMVTKLLDRLQGL